MISLKSKIIKKILAYYFLNPKARHYTRELANALKLDAGNLHRKMLELEQEGLFLSEREGRNKYFFLNDKFPLLKEYKRIFEAKFGVPEILASTLKGISNLNEAYIFGSYAKGGFADESDIDLLLIGNFDYDTVSKLMLKLEKRWGREINIVDFSLKEYAARLKKKDDFLENVFSGETIKII
jgi:predicted nucleotidyltransferase